MVLLLLKNQQLMKKYIFILLALTCSLLSCNKKISIEKKWITTDNNYLLLTQPNDSLSYHWEGGVFENEILTKSINESITTQDYCLKIEDYIAEYL